MGNGWCHQLRSTSAIVEPSFDRIGKDQRGGEIEKLRN